MYRPHSIAAHAALGAALSAGLLACGDDSSIPFYYSSDAGNGDAAHGGDDVAADAAGGDAEADIGVGTDATTDTGGATAFGGVTVVEVRAPGIDALESGGVGAGFSRTPADLGAPIATVGDCDIRPSDGVADLFAAGPSLDAGLIDVTIADEAFTLTHNGESYASSADEGRTEFFAGGDTIRAKAPGSADVPAFDVSWTAPTDPVITSPEWGFLSSHDRAQPLAVEWDGAAASSVIINLLPVQVVPEPGIAEGNSITCALPDSGSATIPAEALAYLPEGEGGLGGGSVALTVVRLSNAETNAGGATLTMNATASHTVVGAIP